MASVNFDQVAADAMLKQMYDVPAMQDLSYSDRPFFALVNKRGEEGGNGSKIPLAIATSQGFAPTLAQAQQTLAAQDLLAFVVTPITLLSVARISGITLEASMQSKQAFARGAKQVIDAAVKRLANGVSSGLFRDGSGVLAQVSSVSNGVITLTFAQDSVQFEVNQAIQIAANSGTQNAPVYSLSSTTVYYITAVDRNSGTITVSQTLGGSTYTGFSASQYSGILTANTFNLTVRGLGAWLTSAGLSTPFYGVLRSADPVRLAGTVFDGSSLSVKDALVTAINRAAREGAKISHVFLDFESYTQLAQDLQANVIYMDLEGPGKVSFSGFRFQSPKGEVIVVADRDCPPKTAFGVQLDTWSLLHVNAGEVIFLDDNGIGSVWRTVESYDGREVRAKFYGNLSCNAPGWNFKCLLSA